MKHENQTDELSTDADPTVQVPRSPSSKQGSLSRRSFLSHAGTSTGMAAAGIGFPALLLSGKTQADEGEGEGSDESRRSRSYEIRVAAARAERTIHTPHQINNGDEEVYPNFIGNYSQGLPHNSIGEVDPAAYGALLTAVKSGTSLDFAKIPLGGNVKLAGPQGGLAFDLQGTDGGQLTIPPAPKLASAERAGEMVEDYWMALARDTPFSQFGAEPITLAAIADLNKLSDFRGPRANGQVTAATLFRGLTPGDLIGPYLSQFFLLPVSLGTLNIKQSYATYTTDKDYLTDFASWLKVQNGQGPFPSPTIVSSNSYLKSARDLGAWVRGDVPYQAYLVATQWLLGNKVPFNAGNPYLKSANQAGIQTFGSAQVQGLLGVVMTCALKAMWYQKWFVHRTLRPLAYGGLVHNTITGVAQYPLHGDVLNSSAIGRIIAKHGSYLLPAAYPEGNPQHPSYGEGHGVIAGACVTLLKAFFNEGFVIPQPMKASDDGQSLLAYTGADAGQITVGGELNKLASNVALGRNMAGVHWRSDATQALLLGEAVTISILRDNRATYNESFDGFTFTKFDGTTVTV